MCFFFFVNDMLSTVTYSYLHTFSPPDALPFYVANGISGPRVRSRWSAMRMRTIDHAACPNAKPVSTLAEHALRMERFAALIDALIYTRSRNGKLKLIADYLRTTPDPDRGWALAALTGGLDFPAVKGDRKSTRLNSSH